jgi:hypothetical protein
MVDLRHFWRHFHSHLASLHFSYKTWPFLF